ncbi:hypothetical protein AAFF_G00013570 [Aldrovandia affinis]|uniref:Gypsy retrotransposon integrase-like protein 1 n=1 Tax=Aldrovandia affinis TaxID=143900 RepID=A0AAD7S6F1_9TELE|nr:hypothetical protein AAFF_G00013570 [Aldrovandia affinis]
MESLTPPPPLSLSGNLAENWRKWEQRLNLYFVASGLTDKSEERKIAVMLHCVGEDALEIYNALNIQYADAQAKKMEEVLTAFRQYCAPRKNTVFERHQFWAHKHNEEAGIDKFVTELRLRARDCEFGESEDLMLRDKIVFSIADHRLRERLLSTADLPLHKAIDICRAKEAATMQARATAPNSSTEEQLVHAGHRSHLQTRHGAEANVLPLAVAEGLPMPLNMQRTDTVLVAYGGARIQPKGVVKLLVQARRKQAQLYFFVTDASDTPLLGRQACVQLDLVRRVEALARSAPATKQQLLQQYSSVFEGLGGSITQLVQAASETDEEMLLLKDLHTGGWPDRRKSVPPRAQPYWSVRHSLYIDDGLVMVNKRIVVPKSLRAEVLQQLHTAHQGIQRSLAHARAIMYWPGLSNDVRAMVDSCSSCQEQLPSNQREPLLPHPVPDAPWQRIAADIFELQGRPFLLITDYYSKFPEVLQLPDKTAGSVIARFKAVFSRHGVPFTLIADHLLMGRVLRSNLPISNAALQPSTPVNVREGLARCQWRQKESYDKTAAPLLPFRTGERVRMETAQGWQPASIVRAREEPRSYDIITPSGATYRRNRKHLRPDRAARHDDQQDDIEAPDSDTEQGATPVEAPEPGANAPESQSAPCTRSGRRIKPPVRLKDYDTASD